MNKDELLDAIRAARKAMVETIELIPAERRGEPGLAGGWSVKDSIVHINYWEGQLVTMLYQLRAGAVPTTVHFTDKTVDEINASWFAQGKTRSWDMAWADFNGLGGQILRRVGEFKDRELNDPTFHPKLEGIPLYEWIGNDSYGHENEHRAAIEAWLKDMPCKP